MHINNMKKIVLTYGDLNGIGPEILIKALNELDLPVEDVMIAGSKKVFDFYAQNYNLRLNKSYEISDVPLDERAFNVGNENAYSGEHCLLCLQKVCELIKSGYAKNIVTAPVSKHVLNLAGHKFSGQTEVLEKFLAKDNEKSEMLFCAGDFRMLLLTRHIPLNEVSGAISKDLLTEKICRLKDSLQNNFGLNNPKIGVLALNPHAGENGLLGHEEIEIIKPGVLAAKQNGVDVEGPLVADAAFAQFARAYFNSEKLPYDCYAAMYHDQGLIPVKLLAQDTAVNTTIGLCAIRTSPSHGTAFDIAGKNIARPNSMIAAIELALSVC